MSRQLLLPHCIDQASPLFVLFCGFPVERMRALLALADSITTAQYADRLLARLEVVLNGGRVAEEAFAASALEEMAPSHLKYATRLAALLEATKYAQILVFSPKIDEKTRQAARFIRKCAASARKYSSLAPTNTTPALFSDVLNEIALIIQVIDDRLPEEREKWHGIALHLEPLYLRSSITLSLSTDRIDTDKYGHPVSTCIDESFYCLKSSLTRTPNGLEAYLQVIDELLIGRISELLKGSQMGGSAATLVLLNNVYYCGLHLGELIGEADEDSMVMRKCTDLQNEALRGLYSKLSLAIPNVAPNVLIQEHFCLHFPKAELLAPQLLEELKLIHLQSLAKTLMQSLLDGKRASNLSVLLHQRVQSDWQGSLAFEAKVQSTLQRVNQAIELLSADDPAALLEELKAEGSLILKAGEIMILLERVNK